MNTAIKNYRLTDVKSMTGIGTKILDVVKLFRLSL